MMKFGRKKNEDTNKNDLSIGSKNNEKSEININLNAKFKKEEQSLKLDIKEEIPEKT